MVSQEDLYNSLKNMIEWTKDIQYNYPITARKHNSLISWAKELCTIKFYLPRQSGHTTFAKKLFEEFFQKAIYLTSNYSILENTRKYTDWKDINGTSMCRLGTTYDVERGKFKGITPDAIIIDCASELSSEKIDIIYNAFSPIAINQPTFIFLFLE